MTLIPLLFHTVAPHRLVIVLPRCPWATLVKIALSRAASKNVLIVAALLDFSTVANALQRLKKGQKKTCLATYQSTTWNKVDIFVAEVM